MANRVQNSSLKKLIYLFLFIVILGLASLLWYRNWRGKFEAPRHNTQMIEFTISKDTTLDAVIGDLQYYDFIKDKEAFRYALEHAKDTNPGKDNSLKVGNNTIDREARYAI